MTAQTEGPPARFVELKPALTADQARAEADRCLYCYDAPCTRACPTQISVPTFIKKIASGNLRGAARTILEANILGFSCARVCPTEVLCEGACVLNDLHGAQPIAIGRLQRYATDPVILEADPTRGPLFAPGPASERKVAVIGAGPAGLACAAELRRRGHAVTVFEAAERAGGLNSFGVADYKMDHASAQAEVDWLQRELGFEVRLGQRVGETVALERLLSEHDALFIGVGLAAVPPLGIPGEELPGCRDVLEFIAELKTRPKRELSLAGRRVAVIGGGNTAIDGVTQAARLGADHVFLVYRRGREQMKAYAHELALAQLDGVELVLFAKPTAVLGSDRVSGLRCQRTRLRGGKLEAVEDGTFELAVDLVLRATGQGKHALLSQIEGLALEHGVVVVDEHGRTSHDKIWAGGDCANGGKEVVNAVAEGRRAALSIDRSLGGRDA